MAATADWIDERLQIPDLLRAAPETRPVLDRYGLRGCGGPLGPVESLGFFAKAHDVPLAQLLVELRRSVGLPAAPAVPAPDLADTIYRPFFKAGIAIVLTLGAVWGAYLLLRIGILGSFTAVGIHEVNAHGHAQIFGWVGLFVMGFALQAFPRFKHTSLAWPQVAYTSLWLMIAGILGRSVTEPLVGMVTAAGWIAVAASVLEIVAIGLFVTVIGRTFRKAGKALEVYDYYILNALGWFVVQAVYETFYLAATVTVATPDELLALVSTWQPALRDLQIHGFALLMILGVSQRLFHNFYGLPAPGKKSAAVALVALNVAVAGEAVGLVLMRHAGHAWAGLWYLSVLVLAGAVVSLVLRWRLLSPAAAPDRSLKFLRTAYAWLFASLTMLVLLPAYQYLLLPALAPESTAARIGFSHAYYGAVRHAITVGFVSLMIVGVAAKIVPTLNGLDVHRLAGLWVPFILLNAGCTLRVTAQTLTDFTAVSFPVAGASGLLEVAGLAVWGVHLWRIMAGQVVTKECTCCSGDSDTQDGSIRAGQLVGDVVTRHPELLDVFLAHGFTPLANPLLRRTLARNISIERACRLTGQDPAALVAALNARVKQAAAVRWSLPVLD